MREESNTMRAVKTTIKAATSNKKPEELVLYFNEDPFKLLGKKVRLQSGGPIMTVVAFTLYQNIEQVEEWRYECGWFDTQNDYAALHCNGKALALAE